MNLSELMDPHYDKQGVKVANILKESCERCGEKFMTRDKGSFECPCGIVIYEKALLDLEYKYRVRFLLKREALIADGWMKCPECKGWPKSGIICFDCFGVGAIERFDCNGNCWSCGPNLGKKYKTESLNGSSMCPMCSDAKTKTNYDLRQGESETETKAP